MARGLAETGGSPSIPPDPFDRSRRRAPGRRGAARNGPHRGASPRAVERFGSVLLFPLAGLFIFLIWHLYPRIQPTQGFDYQGHLDYVRFIDLNASLPLANQGWEMYHPP